MKLDAASLDLISTLLQSGVGALALYLYFQERTAHGASRKQYIDDLKELHNARIQDHKFWLDFVGDLITAGVGKPLFQPTKEPPTVKTQHMEKK